MSKLITGQPAPLFELDDLTGQRVTLSQFRGKMVLVNFWSAECPWSEQADRALQDWTGQVILLQIASNSNEPLELLREAAEERGLPYVLQDRDHAIADLYGAETTPHCFLIDEAGILRYQGAFNDVTFRQRTPTRWYVIEAMQALKAGEQVSTAETAAYGCTIVRETV